LKRRDAQTGAITLIQCFGSAANLNIHLHCLVLDGVYRIQNDMPEFRSVRSPTAYLPGRHHDHLRRSRAFSIPVDSNPSFSDLFLIELIIPLGRLSHERQKCF